MNCCYAPFEPLPKVKESDNQCMRCTTCGKIYIRCEHCGRLYLPHQFECRCKGTGKVDDDTPLISILKYMVKVDDREGYIGKLPVEQGET